MEFNDIFLLFIIIFASSAQGTKQEKPNVLFLVVDDLRPALGTYDYHMLKTPNIDQFASHSVKFENAHAQQTVCGPSRTSFLTSRRPDTTRLYDFGSYWRNHAGNFTTLPQHFKQSGYFTYSIGKIFHPGICSGHNDDFPYSWSEPAYHPPTQKYKMSPLIRSLASALTISPNRILFRCKISELLRLEPGAGAAPGSNLNNSLILHRNKILFGEIVSAEARDRINYKYLVCPGGDGKGHVNLLCAVNVTTQPQQSLPDIQSADHAVEMIQKLSSSQSDQPFFLAVGFHKPHIPYKFPQQFLDLYPLDEVDVAPYPSIPKNMPLVAYSSWPRLFVREDFKSLNVSFPFGPIPREFQKKIRQHYYASVSYTDSMIGKVLNELEKSGLADNTIISLISDHGWSLGDHGDWCKYENFEVVTRVPVIVHVPPSISQAAPSGGGELFPFVDVFKNRHLRFPRGPTSHSLVELVDLFPTLSELASLEIPPTCPQDPFNVDFCTEGASFVRQLTDATKETDKQDDKLRFVARPDEGKSAVFSQYPRPSEYPQEDTDLPDLKNIKIMGYTMRTHHYRYTEWVKFDPTTFTADFTQLHARELYLHDSDPLEIYNVADFPLYRHLVERLRVQLIAGWRYALPK